MKKELEQQAIGFGFTLVQSTMQGVLAHIFIFPLVGLLLSDTYKMGEIYSKVLPVTLLLFITVGSLSYLHQLIVQMMTPLK